MRQLEMKIATLATLRDLLHVCSFHLNVQALYESIHEQKSVRESTAKRNAYKYNPEGVMQALNNSVSLNSHSKRFYPQRLKIEQPCTAY